MPSAPTSFAGFTLKERIAVDTYGETFLAVGPGGRTARVRRLDAALTGRRGFARTLLAGGERLVGIEHPNVVSTIAVGRAPDGALMVVTDDVAGLVTLEQVLRDASLSVVRPSLGVSLYLARAVARALARAHRAGVVHGGVHPRSVWVDIDGEVRLGDFAIARALAAAAAEDGSLFIGMLGYVAPELALGDELDARSDVYASGALLHELVTGTPPPGPIDGPPGLVEAVKRALGTEPDQRYRDGAELSVALDAVAAQLGHLAVGPREVARFVAESRGAAEASLDAETEGLLADLAGGAGDGIEPRPGGRRATERDAPTFAEPTPLPPPMASHEIASGSFAALRDSGAVTAVQPEPGRRRPTPLPLRPPEESVTAPRPQAPASAEEPADEPAPAPEPPPGPEASPEPSPARRLRAPSTPAATTAPPPAPLPVVDLLTDAIARPRGGLGWVWGIALVVALGALGVVILRLREKERERDEAARLAAEAQKPPTTRRGDVIVESDPPEAAVWMLLGRTPLDTMPLDSGRLYELRVEHDGYKVRDLVLTPAEWQGSGDQMSAALSVTLEPAPSGYVAPASPPEPPPAAAGAKGKGRIRVESQPPGSQVWLLVGFTPSTRVTNLPTDVVHELKVVKDGFAPGFVVIKPSDFQDASGAPRSEARGSVTLSPRP